MSATSGSTDRACGLPAATGGRSRRRGAARWGSPSKGVADPARPSSAAVLEGLEPRLMLDAGGGANVVALLAGELTAPGQQDAVALELSPTNCALPRTEAAMLGLHLAAAPGSALNAAAVEVAYGGGQPVQARYVRPDLPGTWDSLALFELSFGQFDLLVGGEGATTGAYELAVFLVGDADGDHDVDEDDTADVRAAYGTRAGDPLYVAEADANLDGRITSFDVTQHRRNLLAAVAVDLAAPSIDAWLANDTGASAGDGETYDATVSGTVGDDSAVASLLAGLDAAPGVEIIGELWGGSFTLTPADLAGIHGGPVGDGPHTLNLQAADEHDNVSGVFSLAFTLDTTPPAEPAFDLDAASDTEPVGDGETAEQLVTLTGLTDPDTPVVLLQTGAGATSDGTGAFVFPDVVLAPGDNSFTVTATDPAGNTSQHARTIKRIDETPPDYDPPVVTLTLSDHSVPVGSDVTFTVTATDNVAVTALSLLVAGQPIALDPSGMATVSFPAAAAVTVEATAGDAAGNTATAVDELLVFDLADTTAPTVQITSPADGAAIGAVADVIGTALDETELLYYTLSLAPTVTGEFVQIARGEQPVVADVLGQLSPALLANDVYTLRLTAVDTGGNAASVERTVGISSAAKRGDFSVSFVDLSIPVSGVPIVVSRTYSTLESNVVGEFGYGWDLDLSSALKVRTNRPMGEGWRVDRQGMFFYIYTLVSTAEHKVTVILPNGREEVFDFTPTNTQASFPFGTLTYPRPAYTPRAGTLGTLEPLSFANLNVTGPQPGTVTLHYGGSLYDPGTFKYTDQNGTAWVVDEIDGVRSITDRNGNTTTFDAGGITSSTGLGVTFTRDGEDRITEVIDPAGNSITYDYGPAGDLVAVTDQEGNTTRFNYYQTPAHYLRDIIDPLGRRGTRNEYDEDGRLVAIIDPDGNRIEYAFDITGRVETVSDARGYPTVYVYDDRGNALQQTDALGNTTLYTYDGRDNMLTETNPLGYVTAYTYDPRDNLLTKTDPGGNVTSYTYNGYGQVLTVADPRGNTTTYAYDGRGNLDSETDPLGNVTTHTHDLRGNRLTTTDPLGHTTTWTYDAVGNPLTETDPLGNVTTYTYDTFGNELTETRTRTDASGQQHVVTTTSEYDTMGRLVAQTDSYGNTDRLAWNGLGTVAWKEDVLGQRVDYRYNPLGDLTRADHADGAYELWQYDEEGNLIEHRDRFGFADLYAYDPLSRKTEETWTDGTSIKHEYDAAGREIATITNGVRREHEYASGWIYQPPGSSVTGRDPRWIQTAAVDALGRRTEMTHDACGNATSVTSDGITVDLEYDTLNRQTATILPSGKASAIVYDASGRPQFIEDVTGQSYVREYDAKGQLVAVTDALGNRTRYTYDEMGNRISTEDALGRITRWEYDDAGRVLEHTLPLGQTESYTYGPTGAVLTYSDFMGRTTQYAYDALLRMTRKTWPDGTQVDYTYGQNGERETVTDDRGVTSYDYDGAGRVVRLIPPEGNWISYTYDSCGGLASLTTANGGVTYTYTATGQLDTVTDPQGRTTTYAYDARGSLSSTLYPNGVISSNAYDGQGRLSGTEVRTSQADLLEAFSYTYDPAGQISEITEYSGRVVSYSYDAALRLIGESVVEADGAAWSNQYALDVVGNRQSVTTSAGTSTYTYDLNDRLLSDGEYTYQYDGNGNRISRADGQETWLFGYDFENRLMSVQGPTGLITNYQYDDDGTRISKTESGTTTLFTVDTVAPSSRVVEEVSTGGALVAFYTYGDALVSREAAGGVQYYHGDYMGSTQLISDAVGNELASFDYDAYGQVIRNTAGLDEGYFYAGERQDLDLGVIHLRARDYDPSSGRFLTRDTWEGAPDFPATQAAYVYCLSSPSMYRDPSGHMAGYAGGAAAAFRDITKLLGIGSFASGVFWVVGHLLWAASQKAEEGALSGRSHSVGISNGGTISIVWGTELLDLPHLGMSVQYDFAGFSLSAAVKLLSTSWQWLPTSTHAWYRGGVWGVSEPRDYTGFFVGWFATIGPGIVGGAASLGVVSFYGGFAITIPTIFDFSIGGSFTLYSYA